MKVVRVKIDGTMNTLDLNLKKKGITKLLENNSISKGTSQFKELYEWNHDKKKIICYGWYDGDAGFENKHELSKHILDSKKPMIILGESFLESKSVNYLFNKRFFLF